MKCKSVRLLVFISLSLLLVTFCNETYADISRYNWEFPHPPVKMIPVKEGMCALTGMAGKFRGGGEAVFVDQSGDRWYLGGFSKQGYMWAQAHCIKYKDFGKDFANIKYISTSDWLGCNVEHCGPDRIETYRPSAGCTAVFLQGVSGDFERPSAWHAPSVFGGYVTWKDGAYTYGWVGVSASGRGFIQEHTQNNWLYATMRGKLGCLHGNVPNMNKKNNNIEYKVASFKIPQNQDVQTNYRANSYFCTMSRVAGYFHGGGERVNLAINSKGEWIMQGQSMQVYSGMSAWCFRYK
jgi:hypothetical protein